MLTSRMLFGLAFLVAGGAVVLLFLSPQASAEPPLVVTPLEQDLGILLVGNHPQQIQISNPSKVLRHVVGVRAECGENCCCRPLLQDKLALPAGGTLDYEYEILVNHAGPFELHVTLFLEENGLHETILTVRGVGVSPQGNLDAPVEP